MEMELNLEKGYLTAYRMACESLAGRAVDEICINTGASHDKINNSIHLKYLNREYAVGCSSGEVELKDSKETVTNTVKVLILHYLLNAKNKPLSCKLISFKELKGGAAIYYQTFYKRAVTPLVKTFGNNFEGLYSAAARLGGIKEKHGHASVTIKVLPLVPVTYVLWQGDDEVPASGTILFDDSIESFLPAEDIVCTASFGVYELMRLSKT